MSVMWAQVTWLKQRYYTTVVQWVNSLLTSWIWWYLGYVSTCYSVWADTTLLLEYLWLDDRSVIDHLIDLAIDLLISWLIDWFNDSFHDWLIDGLADRLIDLLIKWRMYLLFRQHVCDCRQTCVIDMTARLTRSKWGGMCVYVVNRFGLAVRR